MKKEKGVTLVALTITVVILLILAGVMVVSSLGDNGLLNKSEKAVILGSISQVEEAVNVYVKNQEQKQILQGDYSGTVDISVLVDNNVVGSVKVKDTGKTVYVIKDFSTLSLQGNYGKNTNHLPSEVNTLYDLSDVFIVDENSWKVSYIKNEVISN